MTVYRRIRDLREDMDLTQEELGKKIGVPQRAYSYYECSKRAIPLDVLIRLAEFYNTSVDYLLGITDIKTPYPHSRKRL